MTASEDFDRAIEASHPALDEIARGDPSAFFELYSQREDVTVANPFGPPVRGRGQVEEAGRRAASNYRDGGAIGFENFAKCVGSELRTSWRSRDSRRKPGGARTSLLWLCASRVFSGARMKRGSSCTATRIR